MADTYTTNLNLTKPEPGAAEDTWGISLNADLDALDAIFSSSGTQINLNPNQINFADNKKAIFGAGNDLQIYHDGSNSIIKDAGAGNLELHATNLIFKNSAGDSQYASFFNGGAVTLRYAGAPKLATTSTGIDVTGTVTSDGLTVDGDTILLDSGSSAFMKIDRGSNSTFGIARYYTAGVEDWRLGTINDSTSNFYLQDASSIKRFQVATNGDISFYDDTGSTQALFWDSSAEKLGIGTTSPSTGLHLSKDDGSAELTLQRTGTYASSWSLKPYNSDFFIRESGTDRVTVKAGGNVGIGTTSPNAPLHVKSSIDYVARFESTDTTAGILLQDSNASGRVTNTNGHLILSADVNNQVSNSAIRFMLDTSSNSGADAAMVVRSTGVGIGTSSPSAALHVNGGIKLSDNNYLTWANSNTRMVGQSGYLQFQIAGSDSMRLTPTGLGIGTSSPDSKLTIYNADTGITGLFKLWTNTSNNTGADGGAIEWIGSGDSTAIGAKIAATRVEGGGKMDMRFYTGRDSDSDHEKMRILVNGNVGIGTTNISDKLTVLGATKVLETDSANTSAISLDFSGSLARIRSTINGTGTIRDLGFFMGGSEKARLDTSGNLLVGTTSTTIDSSNRGILLSDAGRIKNSVNTAGGGVITQMYGTAGEFRIKGDGDAENTNNSYGSISDERLKENIADATPKLEKLKQVQVKTFNLVNHDLKQIGVIAQELESVFPSLVKDNDDGYKTVKYSVFVPILIKSIQEQQEQIESLKSEIANLKGE